MFRRTKICAGLALAFGGTLVLSLPVAAQTTDTTTQRIEITGSAIKRIDAETSVPVTVIKLDDLKKEGITTVEQVMNSLSAVQVQVSTNFAVGANSGGAAFADLRGIGQNKTLVLLNGRRIANNAVDGSAPDLNTIPFAAIERIEVLRDGASALYGTDAIGGVINFITRRDYVGGTLTIGGDNPQHSGGESYNFNVGYGFGDLDTQRFNIFGFFDAQNQASITGTERPFNSRFAGGLSGSTSPANYYQDGTVVGNPSSPSCASGVFLIPAGDGTSCKMTTSSYVDYVPKSTRYSAMLKGTFKFNDALQGGLEYFATKTTVETHIAPVPYGALIQNPFTPTGAPNPYYPGNSGNAFTPAFTPDPAYDDGSAGQQLVTGGSLIQPGFVNVKWRDVPNGPRGDKNVNFQERLVASLEGAAYGWDYQAAYTFNSSKVDEYLVSGYNNGDMIQEGVLDGIINPYGAQSAAGTAFLNSALQQGLLEESRGIVNGVDGHISREFGDWFGAGRKTALALGAEYRHESFKSAANTSYAELVVASTGIDPTTVNEGSRNVYAGYAELNVPIFKSLDITGSFRYDKYSDVGNTTNPKISFRWQPITQALFRGSYSTGFRAPTLYELHGSQTYGNTGEEDNPFTCLNGVLSNGATSTVNNCATQFEALSGGNLNLKPEKSKSASFGVVLEPIANASLGLDFWWIRLTQTIGSLPEQTAFTDPAFIGLFHPVNGTALSTDGTQCPGANCGYVDLRTQNLGGTNTNGLDISAAYKYRTPGFGTFSFGLNSTYVAKYEYQDFEGGPWNQNVGVWSGVGPIFRWQHNGTVNWNLDPFSLGIAGHFKSGYGDELANADGTLPHVSSYTTLDLFGTWTPLKAVSVTLGVRNLADRAPPFTDQTQNFQGGGWDSRFTDPTGRTYYARATYSF